MRIYLAGPMSHLPLHNYPAFAAKATELRAMGYDVVSPAELNDDWAVVGREVCMRRDIEALMTCNAAYFMRGWRVSAGATCEHQVATQIGLKLMYEETTAAGAEPALVVTGA